MERGGRSEKMAMRQQWMNRSERWKQEIRKGGKNCSAMVEICRKTINGGGFQGGSSSSSSFLGGSVWREPLWGHGKRLYDSIKAAAAATARRRLNLDKEPFASVSLFSLSCHPRHLHRFRAVFGLSSAGHVIAFRHVAPSTERKEGVGEGKEGRVEEEELAGVTAAAAVVISSFLTRRDPKEPAGRRRDTQRTRGRRVSFYSEYFIVIIQPLLIMSACTYSCTAAVALCEDEPRANAASAATTVLPSSRRRKCLHKNSLRK